MTPRGVESEPAKDDAGLPPSEDPDPSEAFQEAAAHFKEAGEYLSYYFAAKVDGFKASFLKIMLTVATAVVVLLVGAGTMVAAGVLLATGLSGALSALWGGPRWTGDLAFGGVFLGAVVIGMLVVRSRIMHSWRDETVKRYEARRAQQRREFGHDVAERAESRTR